MSESENSERAEDLRQKARDCGLTRSGIAIKDHMARDGNLSQALLFAHLLDLEKVYKLAHLRLHVLKASERVQPFKQLIQRTRRNLFRRLSGMLFRFFHNCMRVCRRWLSIALRVDRFFEL